MLKKYLFRYCIISIIAGLTVIGCSTGKIKELVSHQPRIDSEIVIKRGSRFGWGEKLFFDTERFKTENIKQQLESALIGGLRKKGLEFSNYVEQSAWLLSYRLSLDENPDASTDRLSGAQAQPISTGQQGRFELLLLESKSGTTVWRKSVSGFSTMEISDALLKERLLKLVEILLEDFPVPRG